MYPGLTEENFILTADSEKEKRFDVNLKKEFICYNGLPMAKGGPQFYEE